MAKFHAGQKVVCMEGTGPFLSTGNIYTVHDVNPEGYLIIEEISVVTHEWRWGWERSRFEPFPE